MTHVIVAWSVCMSVTLMHLAKAVGQNETPFDRDTRVVSSNTVVDRGPGLHGKGRFGGRNRRRLSLLWMDPVANTAEIKCTVASRRLQIGKFL